MSVAPLSVMIDGGRHLGREWVWPNSCRRQSLVLLRLKPRHTSPVPLPGQLLLLPWQLLQPQVISPPGPSPVWALGRGRVSSGPLTVICWYLADIYCSGAAVTRPLCSLQPAAAPPPVMGQNCPVILWAPASPSGRADNTLLMLTLFACGDWSLVLAWDDDNHHPASCQLISSSHSPRDPPAQSVHRCTHCHCRSRRQKWRGRNYQWIIMLTTRIHCTSTSRPQLRVGTLEPLTLSLLPSGDCCTSLAISRREWSW